VDKLLKNKKTAHQANGDEMPVSDNARHGCLLNLFITLRHMRCEVVARLLTMPGNVSAPCPALVTKRVLTYFIAGARRTAAIT
jgi:hypothetical protein